jgi:hypothetical protein
MGKTLAALALTALTAMPLSDSNAGPFRRARKTYQPAQTHSQSHSQTKLQTPYKTDKEKLPEPIEAGADLLAESHYKPEPKQEYPKGSYAEIFGIKKRNENQPNFIEGVQNVGKTLQIFSYLPTIKETHDPTKPLNSLKKSIFLDLNYRSGILGLPANTLEVTGALANEIFKDKE